MGNRYFRCAYFAVLMFLLPQLAGAAPDYFSVSPVSGKYARALALNDAGRYAVNSAGPDIPYQAASISGWPMSEPLGSLGGPITQIRALNNLGEAVGVSTTAAGEYHSFFYSGGRMQDLTARYGIQDARDINDRGEIAARTADFRAAVLRDGVVDDFGPQNSAPGDMNGRGELLVEYFADGLAYRTAVYRDGVLTDLPRGGGMQMFGQAINDAGWVAGHFTTAEGRTHAFVWDGQTYTNLTPWATNSFAYDINNLGQVVGVADNRAFLYADGELIDLNTRIDSSADALLISADEINDRSQILSLYCDRTGVFCYGSLLLDPVPAIPESSTISMTLAGLALLSVLRLRRKAGARMTRGAKANRAPVSGTANPKPPWRVILPDRTRGVSAHMLGSARLRFRISDLATPTATSDMIL